MKVDLDGAVVLVTGGSGGIGSAISRRLAGAGAKVAIHHHAGAAAARRLAEEIGNGARCFRADLGDPAGAGALFDEVLEHYSRVDVLVNNAGIFTEAPVSTGREEWLAHWNRTLAINLTSVAVLCHAAVNHFIGRGGGRIIHIASRAAFRGETGEYLAYGASKGGMVTLSRSIARAFGGQNVCSFVVAPGLVRTRMIDGYLDRHGEENVVEREQVLPRLTEPDDLAPCVTLLASGMMDHATGCTIDINAGSYFR